MELSDSVFITLTTSGAYILNRANLAVKIDLIESNGESEKLYFDKLYPSDYKGGDIVELSLAKVLSIFGRYSYKDNIPFTNLRKVTN